MKMYAGNLLQVYLEELQLVGQASNGPGSLDAPISPPSSGPWPGGDGDLLPAPAFTRRLLHLVQLLPSSSPSLHLRIGFLSERAKK